MIGELTFEMRGRCVTVELSEDLHWLSDDPVVVDLLNEVCPPEDRCAVDVEGSRHVLYAAAQRLGASVRVRRRVVELV